MLTRKLWSLLAVLMALALVISACAPAATPAPTQPPAPTQAPAQPTAAPPPTAAPTTAPTEAATAAPAVELMTKSAPDCSYGGEMKSIQAVDELTVKFTLCAPDPAFLLKIAFGSMGIQSAQHLKDTGGKPLDTPIGSGPYVLKEWVRGDHVTLEANPNYWGEAPKTKTVIIKWGDSAARLASLQSGEVDGIDNVNKDDFAVVAADKTLKLYPRTPPLNVGYLAFNNTKPPFDNEKVRQAIAIGIDRQAIVDKFFPNPGSTVADYFTPCPILGGCEGDPWPKYNLDEAKKMLADAGVKPGTKLVLSFRDADRAYFPGQPKVAEEFQAQLKKLGFDVTLDKQESGPFLSAASEGKLQLMQLGWLGDYGDQTDWVDYHFGKGASDQFGTKFDDLTAAIEKAAREFDTEQRKKDYAVVNNLIKQHVPMVPIAWGASAVAFKATVEGAHASPLNNEVFSVMQIPGQDQLVFSQNAEPPGLYCADETDGEAFRVCNQIFDSLYRYKVGGIDAEPNLAESCTANADGTEWTCKLHQGAKFSDGTPVTANDVVATYAVQWDAADPLHTGNTGDFTYWAGLFGPYLNAKK